MLGGVSPANLAATFSGVQRPTGPETPTLAPSGQVGAVTEPLPQDFGEVLGKMAMDAVGTIKAGEQTAVAAIKGEANTQQVVEAMMAAEQTLQAGIAIRDKVVSAYMEISRMTI